MKKILQAHVSTLFGILIFSIFLGLSFLSAQYSWADEDSPKVIEGFLVTPVLNALSNAEKNEYDKKIHQLAHVPVPKPVNRTPLNLRAGFKDFDPTAEQKKESVQSNVSQADLLWPVKTDYPNAGAILPFKRIVAYYGNFLSTRMGVLGEYPEKIMLEKLSKELKAWQDADPTTPVVPAIDYIAVTAQQSPGRDGMYRYRMSDKEIDKAVAIANKIEGIVILEVQAGLADLMGEVRALESYLKNPKVHLAIDPEFAMRKSGRRPGTVVGTVDAKEVNEIIRYLADLVQRYHLPPKVLVIHRYTRAMVTNATQITPLAEVQVVMDMDGWGPPSQKIGTYNAFIYPEPVQFTGFKLFYKNDLKRWGSRMLTPDEILKLTPQPSFIQYQ